VKGASIIALIRDFWSLVRPCNVGGRGRVRSRIGFNLMREGRVESDEKVMR